MTDLGTISLPLVAPGAAFEIALHDLIVPTGLTVAGGAAGLLGANVSWLNINLLGNNPSASGAAPNVPGGVFSEEWEWRHEYDGAPQQFFTATFELRLFDVPLITADQSFSGQVGVAISGTLAFDAGTDRPVTSWANLAGGLTADSAGVLAGSPTTMGTYSKQVTASGPGGTSAAVAVEFVIAAGVPMVAPGRMLVGYVGQPFSQMPGLIDAVNRPVTSWEITGLPSWATYNATTGVITGTPLDAVPTVISVTATSAAGSSTESMTISIAASENPPPPDTGPGPGQGGGMKWREARELATAGAAIRREVWPTTRTIIYSRGAGSVRAVACMVDGSVVSVVKNSDFGQAEFAAQDWRRA